MKKTSLQILQELRELLSESFSWTKDTPARDKNGKQVQAQSGDACSWCLIGGLRKIASSHNASVFDPEFREAVDYLLSTVYPPTTIIGRCLSVWQDKKERRHEEVLSVIDRSIEKVKSGKKPVLPSPNRHRYSSGPKKTEKYSDHKSDEVLLSGLGIGKGLLNMKGPGEEK